MLPSCTLCVSPRLAVGANEDCLWYVDKNGTWHNGFDCPLITFCCGNCHRRYCCLDAFKMITEREQKRCMLFQFSPTTIAGIASSILLFVAIIATMVCCFMCSCCYLYQRRQQRGRTPYDGKRTLTFSYSNSNAFFEVEVFLYSRVCFLTLSPAHPYGQHVRIDYFFLLICFSAPPPYSPPQYPGH
uniref:Shisa family member 4 n=1 Tax=Myripristis murdjan TaxID=586833 RepID=A0A667YLJ3_9TELE